MDTFFIASIAKTMRVSPAGVGEVVGDARDNPLTLVANPGSLRAV